MNLFRLQIRINTHTTPHVEKGNGTEVRRHRRKGKSAQMLIAGVKQNCGQRAPEARPRAHRIGTLGKMSQGGAEIGSFLGIN